MIFVSKLRNSQVAVTRVRDSFVQYLLERSCGTIKVYVRYRLVEALSS
jgi:hypothetical protein